MRPSTFLLPLMLTATAVAQAPKGPFTGTDSDGFETQTAGSLDPCVIERVFSDQAGLCTPGGSGPRGTSAGCAKSATSAGCNLTGFGSDSIADNDFELRVDGAIPGQPGLMFGGTTRLTGTLFGDGIRCCGGDVTRLEIIIPDASGAGCAAIDVSSGPLPGEMWCYQFWYRDPNGPCLTGFNLSNAYKVLRLP